MKNDLFPVPELSHDIIVFYLRGGADEENQQRIQTIKEKKSAYEVIFYLIDRYHTTLKTNEKSENQSEFSMTLSEIEKMLLRLLSGNPESNDVETFINNLIHSPQFYQRLMYTIEGTVPVFETATAASLEKITIPADEEIVAKIIEGANEEEQSTRPQPQPNPAIVRPTAGPKIGSPTFDSIRHPAPSSSFPRRVFAYAALILSLFSIPAIHYFAKDDVLDHYVFDDRVPYNPNVWRDAESSLQTERISNLINYQLQNSLRNYVGYNYQTTVDSLEKWLTTVDTLQTQADNPDIACLVRDYYFYLGVSYFALFRSENSTLDEETRTLQIQKATRYLKQAYLIISKCPTGNDKEIFFLGLTHGFSGNVDSAVSELRKIHSESPFYEKSKKLIARWEKH